jgi:myo-inositol-1(or 4)-monophosphatase
MKQGEQFIEGMELIARQAGSFIRQERENFSYQKVEIKGLNDLVSYVDKGAEALIVKGLQELLPEAGYIVEENTVQGKKEYNWIVDPLDGTTNFVHGIPCYSVSIALEHKGEILAGVVYEITRDECFSASKGKGARCNGKSISVSARKHLSESLVATGFPIYNFERIGPYLQTLETLMRGTHGLRRIGSAATDLCYLSCGRVDAFFEYNLNAWDVAAGALIVMEAGGIVKDFSGENSWLFGRELCASNALLNGEFQSLVSEKFRK